MERITEAFVLWCLSDMIKHINTGYMPPSHSPFSLFSTPSEPLPQENDKPSTKGQNWKASHHQNQTPQNGADNQNYNTLPSY